MSAMITKHTPSGHRYMVEVVGERDGEVGAGKGWLKAAKTTTFVIGAILGYIWVASAIFSIITLIR
jgi:hypothetical protein